MDEYTPQFFDNKVEIRKNMEGYTGTGELVAELNPLPPFPNMEWALENGFDSDHDIPDHVQEQMLEEREEYAAKVREIVNFLNNNQLS